MAPLDMLKLGRMAVLAASIKKAGLTCAALPLHTVRLATCVPNRDAATCD